LVAGVPGTTPQRRDFTGTGRLRSPPDNIEPTMKGEPVMRSKMTALAIAGALAGAALLATTTGASAQFWYGYGAPWYGYSAGYGYGYGPGYGYGYGPAMGGVYAYNDVPAGDASYCARRFRSYDPATGTYLGYDGVRHACP
jgi:hypothetical protein